MGSLCPEGCGYQPIVRNITIDGKPARKAVDVIAVELGCGHVVGGEEYKAFINKVREIKNEESKTIQAAAKVARDKMAAAWQELKVKKEKPKT